VINFHKKYLLRIQNKLALSNYAYLWLSFLKGVIVTLIVIWVFNIASHLGKSDLNFKEVFIPSDIGLDSYLKNSEISLGDVPEEAEKKIIWSNKEKNKTEIAIAFLPGFSTTNFQQKEFFEKLSKELDANIFLSRLSGHGREYPGSKQMSAENYLKDTSEAIEIAKRIGKKVILIGYSLGGALTTAASFDEKLSKDLHGVVLFAPAYVGTIRNISLWLYAMSFLDKINHDCNDYINDQKKYDCTKYSTKVFETSDGVQGGHIMSAVAEKDFSANKVPALSFFDYDDDVLNSHETEKRLNKWGNKKSKIVIIESGEKDITQHFIVGFLNPELDEFYIEEISNWINNL
jgi:esterase/lipase